jgi:indole-3-glycerol phosphate synthase
MILDHIVQTTANRVAGLPRESETIIGEKRSEYSLYRSLDHIPGQNPVIAELKFASPSRGVIRPGADPLFYAKMLARGGCRAISVVTEPFFFSGNPEIIPAIRSSIDIPILRKDFIIDERQLAETRSLGADAVLLICGILGERIGEFVECAFGLGLEPLVEVHNKREVSDALDTDAMLIGINNRNLSDMTVDLSTTRRLAPLARKGGRRVVAESGITWPCDVKGLSRAVDGFLIGSSIMSAKNPSKRLEGFVFS